MLSAFPLFRVLGCAAALLAVPVLTLDRAPKPAHETPTTTPFVKGMTITCPRFGQIWGTEAMTEALREVRSLGVEWVAIHPYIHLEPNGNLLFRGSAESTGYLPRAVERARREGVHLFWKPHISYWGSFEWRGAIEFQDEAAWRRFFQGYERFIVDQARFAEQHGIPLFAVGVELEGTTHRPEWLPILRAVRAVYSGRITYAANWDRLHKVPFWNEMDVIGVQAYFPLSQDNYPSRDRLVEGWEGHLAMLRDLSRSLGDKPVIFAEIGYNAASNAAREPWDYRVDKSAEAQALRRLLMEVALERLPQEPYLEGVFWWKWMPGRSAYRSNFSMREPDAQEALRHAWGAPKAPALPSTSQ